MGADFLTGSGVMVPAWQRPRVMGSLLVPRQLRVPLGIEAAQAPGI